MRSWRAERGSELARLRILAHKALDVYWRLGVASRQEVYASLALQMGIRRKDCHIGAFDIEQCRRVIEISNKGLIP